MHYHINLIKKKVFSPEKRRKIFLIISAYLFVCIFAFVVLFLLSGLNLINKNKFQRQVLVLEQKFQDGSKKKNISEYNQEMRAEIKQYLNKLQAIEGALSKNLDVAQVLQRISKTLPKGTYIDNFSLDNEKNNLNFDIVSPVSEDGETVDISGLITLWKKDKFLMSTIENIASSHSQREKKGQQMALISKFSCELNKGGS